MRKIITLITLILLCSLFTFSSCIDEDVKRVRLEQRKNIIYEDRYINVIKVNDSIVVIYHYGTRKVEQDPIKIINLKKF